MCNESIMKLFYIALLRYIITKLHFVIKELFSDCLLKLRNSAFCLVQTYSIGHAGKVTGIIHTRGVLMTCSTDKTIKVLEPNLDPGLIVNLTEMTSEVAEVRLFLTHMV